MPQQNVDSSPATPAGPSSHLVEQLRESEARFRATFDRAPLGLAHFSPTGVILRANAALCGMLGFDCDELAGRRLAELTPSDDLARELEQLLALLAGEVSSYEIEKRFHRKDGGAFWAHVCASLVRDAAGAPLYVVAIVENVSERREAQERLAERERALRSVLAHSPDVVARFDAALRHTYVNAAVERATGRPAESFIGRTNRELGMPAEQCARWDDALRDVLATGTGRTIEFSFESPAGVRQFEAHLVPERDTPEGPVTGVLAIARDVTVSREAARHQVAEARRLWLEQFVERGVVAVAEATPECVLDASDSFLALLGYSRAELDAGDLRWDRLVAPECRAASEAATRELLATGDGPMVELNYLRKDGVRVPVLVGVTLLDRVSPRGAVFVADLRRQHEMEAWRHERDRLLEEFAAYRRLFEAVHAQMPAGFVVAEAPSGRLVHWNWRAETLLGHPMVQAGEVSDYARYGALHADGTPFAAAEYPMARALAGEVVDQLQLRYRRGDGTITRLSVSAAPVYDAMGRRTHAVCSFTDSSERHRIESTLREERERLRAALVASRTGTFRWDIPTAALDWDESLAHLFGLAPGETARSLDEFVARVHPDDRARVLAALERCTARGETFEEEFRIVWSDGTVRWLYDRGETFRDDAGQPSYMTGACVDVTDRRQQEAQLRAMAELMPQIVWTTTATGYHDYFNERWYAFTGMPRPGEAGGEREVPQGWSWKAYLHPDDEERTAASWQRSLETGEPYEIEYRFREAATGRHRWFIGRALPMRDASGRIVRWFGTCTDIDAQVEAREHARRLQRSAARLAAAVTSDEIAEIVLETALPALDASAGCLAMLGTDGLRLRHARGDAPPALLDESTCFSLDAAVPMAEAARTRATVVLHSFAEMEQHAPMLARTAAGSAIVGAAAFPLLVGGEAIGSLGFVFRTRVHFTEEQHRFVEQLAQQCAEALTRAELHDVAQRALREAREADRAKSEFLAVVSHELRSPLAAIDGHAALLEDGIYGPMQPKQQDALARIRRAGTHLATLINDVLNYARLDAGRVEYRIVAVPLDAALRQLEGFMGMQMAERGLTYSYLDVDPAVAVLADADRLRQILLNLLTNAMKFTAAGGRVTVHVRLPEDGTVLIHVRDTGIGIPSSDHERIFDAFVQVDASRSRHQQGVGLGLAISRELARGMGGDLRVDSAPGVGSTFTLRLPRAPG